MKAYIDTGVIISAYKPNEVSHNESLRLAKLGNLTKVGSYVLFAELVSATSRLYGASQIKLPTSIQEILLKLPTTERTFALIGAMIFDWNLSFPNIGYTAKQLELRDILLPMPEAVFEACSIAPLLCLKTLDLMHIACAKMINDESHDLEYFVTLDQDILSSSNKIRNVAGFQPVTPKELLD